jgi:hypothetical protein
MGGGNERLWVALEVAVQLEGAHWVPGLGVLQILLGLRARHLRVDGTDQQ